MTNALAYYVFVRVTAVKSFAVDAADHSQTFQLIKVRDFRIWGRFRKTLISSQLKHRGDKLECLSMAGFYCLV